MQLPSQHVVREVGQRSRQASRVIAHRPVLLHLTLPVGHGHIE